METRSLHASWRSRNSRRGHLLIYVDFLRYRYFSILELVIVSYMKTAIGIPVIFKKCHQFGYRITILHDLTCQLARRLTS